jgi:hypothetical protein
VKGATTPMRPRALRARVTASVLGTKPRASAAPRTFSRVRSLTLAGLLRASETVEMLTPASAATS